MCFWCSFLVLCVFCQGALACCLALFWRPPRCPKGVSGTPFGSSCGRPGVPRRGHRTVVIRWFWGLSGVLGGARWGLARFLRFLLAHFLNKLEVGPRSCTARACLGRLLETLVFYEVLGGVRVWRAGRDAGLGGSRGVSWGLWGPLGAFRGPAGTPKENYRGGSGSSWETLATSGGLRGPVGL